MSGNIQVHHILPVKSYERFAADIALWTDNKYNNNAGYNLTPLSTDASGSNAMNKPMHFSQHPWLNSSFELALQQIKDAPVTNKAKGEMFKGVHSYFRSALDYGGTETNGNYAFLNRADGKAINDIGNSVTEKGVTKVEIDAMFQYYEERHNIESIIKSEAYKKGASGQAANGSFGSLNADNAVYEKSNGKHDPDAYRASSGVDVQDSTTGEFTINQSAAKNYSDVKSQPIPDIIKTEIARKIHTSDFDGQIGGLGGLPRDLLVTGPGVASFDDAYRMASDLVDSLPALDARIDFDPSEILRASGLSIAGGLVADTADFVNNAYDSIKIGLLTGDWTAFADDVVQYGIDAVVGAAVVGLASAVVGTAFGAAAGYALAVSMVVYGVYESYQSISELIGKLAEDWDAIVAYIEGLIADVLPPWFDQASAFFNQLISPLVFDLDDDGLDIVDIEASTAFFDLDQNGFAEKTAWIAPDDGFLAHDVNGNGGIDDLSELFGGQTQDGFTTLSVHDGNEDGAIDAKDAVFPDLVVWRDANGDGLTDPGELTSLASHGITSIDLDAAYIDRWVGGNWLSHESTYRHADGTGAIIDIWFQNDQLQTIYAYGDTVTHPPAVTALPNLRGYGTVKDLHAAMDEDATLRADVEALVRAAPGMTYQQAAAAVQPVLLRWAGADEAVAGSRGPHVDAAKLAFLEALHGQPYFDGADPPGPRNGDALQSYYDTIVETLTARVLVQIPLSTLQLQNAGDGAVDLPLKALLPLGYDVRHDRLVGDYERVLVNIAQLGLAADADPAGVAAFVDAATVVRLLGVDYTVTTGGSLTDAATRVLRDQGVWGSLVEVFDDLVTGAMSAVVGTAGDDRLDEAGSAQVMIGQGGDDDIAGSSRDDVLVGGSGDDTLSGRDGSDIYMFGRGDGRDEIRDTGNRDTDRLEIRGYEPEDVAVARTAKGSDDLILRFGGTSAQVTVWNTLNGSHGDQIEEIIFEDGTVWTMPELRARLLAEAGTAGNDDIVGFHHDDVIDAGDGDDTLAGGHGNDTLNGGQGGDTLNGDQDDDTLVGGAGDDTLHGHAGSDTFVFARGDGRDAIDDNGSYDTDRLKIVDYTPDQTLIVHDGGGSADLVLAFVGTDDQVTVRNTLNGSFADQIEEIIFQDGAVWTMPDLRARILAEAGTNGDDTIIGFRGADAIVAAAGDDAIAGGQGNDTLIGGAGADTLDGGLDDDTLTGGAGDDRKTGGTGSDTYGFARGDGRDEIDDNGSYGADRLEIAGYAPAEAAVARPAGSVSDLVLSFAGTDDQITVRNTLNGSFSDEIEQIVFDDGTVWTMADLRARILVEAATDDADRITGFRLADAIDAGAGDDAVSADAGNDTLIGGAGADTLDGGQGDDTLTGGGDDDRLVGGTGSDTYRFARGDGVDEVEENGNHGADRLAIAGYAPADVAVARPTGSIDDLVLAFAGTDDRITLLNTLDGNFSDEVEQIAFDDGTVWTMPELRSRLLAEAATDGDDEILGFSFAEVIAAGLGDDLILAGQGHDTVIGGAGNDTLTGGRGDDTYVFARGDGRDLIDDDGNFGTERLEIQGYAPEAVMARRADGDANDLVLSFAGSDDQITLRNTLNGSYADQIEQIAFDDGTVWTMPDIGGRLIDGTGGDDALAGGPLGDQIRGRAGNDALTGLAGHDQLSGGPGADTLTGGDGSDVFAFAPGDGQDTVTDFRIGADTIDFRDHDGFHAFDAVLAVLSQTADGALIDAAGGDRILLTGVSASALSHDDFLFV